MSAVMDPTIFLSVVCLEEKDKETDDSKLTTELPKLNKENLSQDSRDSECFQLSDDADWLCSQVEIHLHLILSKL